MTQTLSDNDFIISDVSVTNHTPNFYTESLNFISNTKGRGLHLLEVECTVTLVNEDDIRRFNALVLKVRGRLNPFKLSLLDKTDGKGYCNPFHYNSTPLIANPLTIGNNKMVLSGISGTIPAGSMFQFANDTKVYTLLDEARNNQSIEFFPATRQPHQMKEKLNFSVEPLVRLEDDSFKVKYASAQSITLKMREAL